MSSASGFLTSRLINISLGLVERDGLLISLGILLGLATIAMIGTLGLGILSLFGATGAEFTVLSAKEHSFCPARRLRRPS
jgi:hypothetical protein